MKYIPAEKLKEKIEKKYLDAKEKARFAGETGTSSDCTKWDAIVLQYENVLRIIDSLQQEQPEVDLEKEIDDYIASNFSEAADGILLSNANSTELQITDVFRLARHFWNKGYNARKEE